MMIIHYIFMTHINAKIDESVSSKVFFFAFSLLRSLTIKVIQYEFDNLNLQKTLLVFHCNTKVLKKFWKTLLC